MRQWHTAAYILSSPLAVDRQVTMPQPDYPPLLCGTTEGQGPHKALVPYRLSLCVRSRSSWRHS